MCSSHFCRVRVTSPSSQTHLKFFRVESESWLGRVESRELSSHFESLVCKLESMWSHTKFHVFSTTFFYYQMAPDKLENYAQYCFNKFDRRLFISKFIEIAFYLSLSLSVISKSLAQGFPTFLWQCTLQHSNRWTHTPSAFRKMSMYPFSISTDKHVPLKCLMTK